MLSELFRPPTDMTFKGTFEQARQAAESEEKLLLVNIQTPTEFACQRLNRDTWRDDKLKAFVKKHFVFWQQDDVRDCRGVSMFDASASLTSRSTLPLQKSFRNFTTSMCFRTLL